MAAHEDKFCQTIHSPGWIYDHHLMRLLAVVTTTRDPFPMIEGGPSIMGGRMSRFCEARMAGWHIIYSQ